MSAKLPRAEAPLRDLTAAEIAAYRADGVVRASGLFPRAWVERMQEAVDRAAAEPTAFGRQVSLPESGFRGDLFLWKTRDAFRDFVLASPAAHVAQQVLGAREVRFFYDQLFLKPVGCHVATPWHQDLPFWPLRGGSVCSIWMTFDPVSRESSGLEFVRGSHRWPERYKAVTPDYNAYMLDSDLPDPPDVEARRDEFDLLGWDMQPGDVLVFDSLVLHGSLGNYSTDRARRAFSTRWCDERVRYAPRHATLPLLWDHGLADGDPLAGPLFPRILPEPVPAEWRRRAVGPEPPDPATVARVQAEIAERMAERSRAPAR